MSLNSAADPKGGGQDARNKGLPNCAACGFLKITAFCKARQDSLLLNLPQWAFMPIDLTKYSYFQHTIRVGEVKTVMFRFLLFLPLSSPRKNGAQIGVK
jgi:hypothetical protein